MRGAKPLMPHTPSRHNIMTYHMTILPIEFFVFLILYLKQYIYRRNSLRAFTIYIRYSS
jgi:hypothetical protein